MCVRQSNAVCVTMSSQGGEIAVGDANGTVHVINVDTDEQFINTIEDAHDVCVTYLCLDVAYDDCIIIIITSKPRAGAWRFPRGASSVLDPECISMLS